MTRLLRSVLFVPGVRPDRFASAIGSGADAVVFDLEDSVAPTRKAEARDAVARALAAPAAEGPQRFVRVNGPTTPWHDDDVALVRQLGGADGLVLPKCESADVVAEVTAAMTRGRVVPLLETSLGLLNALAIGRAAGPAPALLFGAEDLTAEIGVARTVDGDELIYVRSAVVLAATAIGADAIDAVFIDMADADGLRRDAARARALGFRGKMAIHPQQIATIHDVFTPTSAERERARRLVDAFDAARAAGEAVIRWDDRMIDAPVVARARRLLG